MTRFYLSEHRSASPRISLFDYVETFLLEAQNIRQTFAEADVPKIRAHGVCYARIFGEPFSATTTFLFAFFGHFLAFFFRERKRERK